MKAMDTNPAVKRFSFTSFDGKEEAATPPTTPAGQPKSPEPLPPAGPLPLPLALPAITEKDIAAARSEAQAQGYREGYAAAQGKFNKQAEAREDAVKSLLEIIANRITIAAETHGEKLKEGEALMAKLVMAAARKVAGDALRKEPYAPVESLLRECTGLIAGEAKVRVIVSNTHAAGLKQRIDLIKPVLQNFSGELSVEEDDALMDQDCRVEWSNGHAERSTEDLWRAVEAIVARTNV